MPKCNLIPEIVDYKITDHPLSFYIDSDSDIFDLYDASINNCVVLSAESNLNTLQYLPEKFNTIILAKHVTSEVLLHLPEHVDTLVINNNNICYDSLNILRDNTNLKYCVNMSDNFNFFMNMRQILRPEVMVYSNKSHIEFIDKNSTVYQTQAWFNSIACLDSYTFDKMLLQADEGHDRQDSVYIQNNIFKHFLEDEILQFELPDFSLSNP